MRNWFDKADKALGFKPSTPDWVVNLSNPHAEITTKQSIQTPALEKATVALKPKPITIPEIPDDYEELARSVGLELEDFNHRFILKMFDELHIPLYDTDEVVNYLKNLARENNIKDGNSGTYWTQEWIKIKNWKQPIPKHVLSDAKIIKDYLMEKGIHSFNFTIGTIQKHTVHPDPFLALYVNSKLYVFGVWDEPRFEVLPAERAARKPE